MNTRRKLWLSLACLALLSPLGLVLPAWLGAGTAWGEWSAEELERLVGYAPAGLGRLSQLWRAPLPDYTMPGQQSPGLAALSVTYVISGLIGAVVVALLALALGRLLARGGRKRDDS